MTATPTAPREIPHAFAFETERVRMLVGLLPAGSEEVFFAFSTPDPSRAPAGEPAPADLPDPAAVEALDNQYGAFYVGPPLRELLGGKAGAQ